MRIWLTDTHQPPLIQRACLGVRVTYGTGNRYRLLEGALRLVPSAPLGQHHATHSQQLSQRQPVSLRLRPLDAFQHDILGAIVFPQLQVWQERSEEHTSELQSRQYLVCRLLLEKKNSF